MLDKRELIFVHLHDQDAKQKKNAANRTTQKKNEVKKKDEDITAAERRRRYKRRRRIEAGLEDDDSEDGEGCTTRRSRSRSSSDSDMWERKMKNKKKRTGSSSDSDEDEMTEEEMEKLKEAVEEKKKSILTLRNQPWKMKKKMEVLKYGLIVILFVVVWSLFIDSYMLCNHLTPNDLRMNVISDSTIMFEVNKFCFIGYYR
uniref:Uncharacterized protein n=1 Tax=Sphaerodactylus townsendi TaxID=933632 RepID=A0ACB8ERY9_9SAUR